MQVFSNESELLLSAIPPLQSDERILRSLGSSTGREGSSISSQPLLALFEPFEKVEQDEETPGDASGGGRRPNRRHTPLKTGSLRLAGVCFGFLAGLVSPSFPQPLGKLDSGLSGKNYYLYLKLAPILPNFVFTLFPFLAVKYGCLLLTKIVFCNDQA